MKKCLNNEKIEKFIKKQLSLTEMKTIKQHLAECKRCYDKYIEYKELLYFKTKPVKVKKQTLNKIIDLYDEIIERKEIVKRFSIIVNVTKKALEVFTDSNFELKSDFVSATLIVKGREIKRVEGDIITLTKKVDNYKIELKIEKIKKEKFKLSVFVYKGRKKVKGMRVYLKVRQQEIESIILSENNQFQYQLEPEIYTLEFEKNKKLLFTIELKIKSEK